MFFFFHGVLTQAQQTQQAVPVEFQNHGDGRQGSQNTLQHCAAGARVEVSEGIDWQEHQAQQGNYREIVLLHRDSLH
ncbi:hypothetical protein D3C76_1801100 [compost metagenome]